MVSLLVFLVRSRPWNTAQINTTLLVVKVQLSVVPSDQRYVRSGNWWPGAKQIFPTLPIISPIGLSNCHLL